MDATQFKIFCDGWRAKGALDFTRKSHFEAMSPLFEAHGEVVEVTKSDFHALTGNVYYPKKETTDKLGHAAGISFSGEVRIVKQADGAWVGTAYPQELGPDGKMVTWAPASYEFNPADRAEEELLRKAVKDNRPEPSEMQLKLKTLEYKKVSARRSDTGARVAAIISAIGMSTGFKDLFSQNDSPATARFFLFSRIIVNTKNEMVLNRALDAMFPATQLLAGPSSAATPTFQEEPDTEEPAMRPAEGQQTTSASVASEALDEEHFDDTGVDDAFDGIPPDIANNMTPRGRVAYIRLKYEKELSTDAKNKLDAGLADTATADERFWKLYTMSQDYLGRKGIAIPDLA